RKTGLNEPIGNFFCIFLVIPLFVVLQNIAEQRRIGDVFNRLVETGELRCCCSSHIWNGKSKKPPRERQGLGPFDRADRFRRIFFPKHARFFVRSEIQFGQLFRLSLKQIEWLAYKPAFHQFVRHDAADTFDVQCAARCKKFDATRRLRWTLKIFTAPGNELRVAPNWAATHRTLAVNISGKIERPGIARAFRFHDFNNGWDDFARLFDYYRVTNADVFALDFILVMQRRTPNSASAYE